MNGRGLLLKIDLEIFCIGKIGKRWEIGENRCCNKGKEVNMCQALEEIEIKGKIEGSVETYREFILSLQDTIQRIAEKFNLSLQKSEEGRKYWK